MHKTLTRETHPGAAALEWWGSGGTKRAASNTTRTTHTAQAGNLNTLQCACVRACVQDADAVDVDGVLHVALADSRTGGLLVMLMLLQLLNT